jgi:hypothetical protein
MLEGGYIDEDFRDEFSHFYAQTHREIPSRCERLHFFGQTDKGERQYLGFVVLRPVVGRPVCRTALSPPPQLVPHISCVSTSTASPYGYPLGVRGFPFISQDSQYGTCAHAAIWMIALYFHQRWRRPRFHLSDLAGSARQHQDLLPSIPSGGLTLRQITAVLHDLQMPPVVYRVDRRLPPGETVESIARRYLNSRLPVLLLSEGETEGHARVLIGYGRDDRGLFFVHHDDQQGPYVVTDQLLPPNSTQVDETTEIEEAAERAAENGCEREKGDEDRPRWHALVVPLPGRIYLAGEAAEKTGKLIFEERIDAHEHLEHLKGGLDDGRLGLRTHVAPVPVYKRALRSRGIPDDVVTWHVNESASRWLWIVELQDCAAAAEGPECVIGEIAIDATSDDQWPNPLFGNLPGVVMRWPGIGDDIEWGESTQDGRPYLTGCALHAA